MNPHRTRVLGPVGLAVAAVLAAAAALADAPVDTSNWKCEKCPFATGYDADAELGLLGASGANAASGRYTGIDRGHAYADVAAHGSSQGASGDYARYALDRLGLASRDGTIEFGRAGRYALELGYDGQPTRLYDDVVSPFRGAGGGQLVLPAGWVSPSATPADLAPLKLEYDRRTAGLKARYVAGRGWTIYAALGRQEKDGTGLLRATFLDQVTELPRPIDYVTNTAEAGIRYSSSRYSLGVGYSGSWFQDHASTLSYDNPYPPIVAGSTTGALAMPPDNSLQQLTVNGELRLPQWSTTLNLVGSDGRLRQTQAFLPISTLPGAGLLAQPSLDGDLHLSHYALNLSSRPLAKLYVRGTASYDGRDDHTPVLAVPYVITDTVAGGTATALRYGEDRTRLEGSADYRLLRWLRVGAGGQYKGVRYAPGQAARWTDDGQWWLRGVVTPAAGLTLTLKGGNGSRRASTIDPSALPASESPLIWAYNLAPRDRRYYSLRGSWAVTSTLSWSVEGFMANDDYRLSSLGLTSAHERRGATTLSYAPVERMSFYVDGAYERRASSQRGYNGALPFWQLDDRARYWSAGAGARLSLKERWDLTLDYVHAPSSAATDTLAQGIAQAFPENTSKLDSLRLDLRYKVSAPLSLHLRYAREKYDSSDWLLAGVGPATIPGLLALGRSPYNYDVNMFGLSAQYRFGKTGAPPAKED